MTLADGPPAAPPLEPEFPAVDELVLDPEKANPPPPPPPELEPPPVDAPPPPLNEPEFPLPPLALPAEVLALLALFPPDVSFVGPTAEAPAEVTNSTSTIDISITAPKRVTREDFFLPTEHTPI